MKWNPLQTALSNDNEPHPSGSPSPIVHVGKPEEVDFDINEEKVAEDLESSNFEGGSELSEELDNIVSVRGEIDEDCKTHGIWDNVASVQNSDDFGVELGPEHLSINDSMSSKIGRASCRERV